MPLTPEQLACRQTLFPKKRGKLNAEDFQKFAELCAERGCPVTVNESEPEGPDSRSTKRFRSNLEHGDGLEALLAGADHAESEAVDPNISRHAAPAENGVDQAIEHQATAEPQSPKEAAAETLANGNIDPAAGLGTANTATNQQPLPTQPLSFVRRRGRPSKVSSAVEGLIQLTNARENAPRRSTYRRVPQRTRSHPIPAAAAIAAAVPSVPSGPIDYYAVYEQFYSSMQKYNQLAGEMGSGQHLPMPKPPGVLFGPAYGPITASALTGPIHPGARVPPPRSMAPPQKPNAAAAANANANRMNRPFAAAAAAAAAAIAAAEVAASSGMESMGMMYQQGMGDNKHNSAAAAYSALSHGQ